jgi:hypothetical protein
VDIDRLDAGPELDWLVLHHALDWKTAFPTPGGPRYTRPSGDSRVDEPDLWPVSADASVVWCLVEHVEAAGCGFALSRPPGGPEWAARVWREGRGEATALAPTAPLAIARAVLKAVAANLVVKGFGAP